MGKLKISTNLPMLFATIYHGHTIVHEDQLVSTSKIIPFANNENPKEIEHTEFILEKGIYSVRLSLPYCNPGDIKNLEQGQMFHMPVVMDKTIAIFADEEIELKFMANLQELKKKFKTKEECYDEATLKSLGNNPNGTRMDVVYLAMDIYNEQFQ